jgi:acetyl-CoA carboxylase biotin carboxyl carrier protein
MDLEKLKALLQLLDGTDVEELEVEEQETRIRVRRTARGGTPAVFAAPTMREMASGPPAAQAATPTSDTAGLLRIDAPMVGTFYRASAPDAEPYVREGDIVQKGTVVCIVEAMKLMNEIESEVRGRLVKIVAENGQPVEYGQTLFLLAPV